MLILVMMSQVDLGTFIAAASVLPKRQLADGNADGS